eukprot:8456872-Pyramimonas_sp.AAC.1
MAPSRGAADVTVMCCFHSPPPYSTEKMFKICIAFPPNSLGGSSPGDEPPLPISRNGDGG